MIYTAHEQIGYSCKDVKVSVSRKLRYMPYAQAGWRDLQSGNLHKMLSYSSLIFSAYTSSFGLEYISVRGAHAAINYSRTTSKQVTAAMQELGLNGNEIAALKKFFTNGGEIAIATHDGKHWVNGDTCEVIC